MATTLLGLHLQQRLRSDPEESPLRPPPTKEDTAQKAAASSSVDFEIDLASAWKLLHGVWERTKDASYLELIVLAAERGVSTESQQYDIAREALQVYFLSSPPVDQFYVRALYARALCEARVVQEEGLLGGEALHQLLRSLKFLEEGLNIARKHEPHYSFLVYNASVHAWNIVRPYLKCETARHFIHVLSTVRTALENSGEATPDWRFQYSSALAIAHGDAGAVDAAVRSAADSLALAEELLSAATQRKEDASEELKRVRAGSRRRSSVISGERVEGGDLAQTHNEVTLESKAEAAQELAEKEHAKTVKFYEGALLGVLHFGHKASLSADAKKVLDACQSKVASSSRLKLLATIQKVYEGGFSDSIAAETALQEALTTLGKDASISNVLELCADAGLAAFRAGARELAVLCSDRVEAAKGSVSQLCRARADLLKAAIGASSLNGVVCVRDGSRKLSQAESRAFITDRVVESFKLADRALSLARRLGEGQVIEAASILLYNISLDLLSHKSQRKILRQGLSNASTALEKMGSSLANLRAKLHAILSRCELESEFLVQATKEAHNCLLIEYGPISMERAPSWNPDERDLKELGFEDLEVDLPSMHVIAANEQKRDERRPLDMLATPLAHILVARQDVWSDGQDPNSDLLGEVSRLLDRIAMTKSEHLCRTLLEKCVEGLEKATAELIHTEDGGHSSDQSVEEREADQNDQCESSSFATTIQALSERSLNEEGHAEPQPPLVKMITLLWDEVAASALSATLRKLTRHACLSVVKSGPWDPSTHRHLVGLQAQAWFRLADTVEDEIQLPLKVLCLRVGLNLASKLKPPSGALFHDGYTRLWNCSEPHFGGNIWDYSSTSLTTEMFELLASSHLSAVEAARGKFISWSLACNLCAAFAAGKAKRGDSSSALLACEALLEETGPTALERKDLAILAALLGKTSSTKAPAGKGTEKKKGSKGSAAKEDSSSAKSKASALPTLASLTAAEHEGLLTLQEDGTLEENFAVMVSMDEEFQMRWTSLCTENKSLRPGDPFDIFLILQSDADSTLEENVAQIDVRAEAWCALARGLQARGDYQRACFCSSRALSSAPRDEANAARLVPTTWRWISIAGNLRGIAISSLISPVSQELTTQDSLSTHALEAFVESIRFAVCRARDPELFACALINFWKVVSTMASSVAGRKLVKDRTSSLLGLFEGNKMENSEAVPEQILANCYSLLCQCHADDLEWHTGVSVAERGARHIGLNHQGTLSQWLTYFSAKLASENGGRVKGASRSTGGATNDPRSRATAKLSLAKSCSGAPATQLAAYMEAVRELQGNASYTSDLADVLVSFGEWMQSQNSVIPLADANDCFCDAIDILLSRDEETAGALQMAQPLDNGSASGSQYFRAESSLRSGESSLCRGDSCNSQATLDNSALTSVRCSDGKQSFDHGKLHVRHMELLLRAFISLAQNASFEASRAQYLLSAAHVSRRTIEMHVSALRTAQLKGIYSKNCKDNEAAMELAPLSYEDWLLSESGLKSCAQVDAFIKENLDAFCAAWSPPPNLHHHFGNLVNDKGEPLMYMENPSISLLSLLSELADMTYDNYLPCASLWHCRLAKLTLAICPPPLLSQDLHNLWELKTARIMLSLGGDFAQTAASRIESLVLGLTPDRAANFQGDVERIEQILGDDVAKPISVHQARSPTDLLPIRRIWSALARECVSVGCTSAAGQYIWGANRHNIAYRDIENAITCVETEARLALLRGKLDACSAGLRSSACMRIKYASVISAARVTDWGKLARSIACAYHRSGKSGKADTILREASCSLSKLQGGMNAQKLDLAIEELLCEITRGTMVPGRDCAENVMSSMSMLRSLCGSTPEVSGVHPSLVDALPLLVSESETESLREVIQADALALLRRAAADFACLSAREVINRNEASHPLERVASAGLCKLAETILAKARLAGQHRSSNHLLRAMGPVERFLHDTDPERAKLDAPIAAAALTMSTSACSACRGVSEKAAESLSLEAESLAMLAIKESGSQDPWEFISFTDDEDKVADLEPEEAQASDPPTEEASATRKQASEENETAAPLGSRSTRDKDRAASPLFLLAVEKLEMAIQLSQAQRDWHSAARVSLALAELSGIRDPLTCARGILLSQSCRSALYLDGIFRDFSPPDGPTMIRMERSRFLSQECKLPSVTASPLRGVDLQNSLGGSETETETPVWKFLNCNRSVENCLSGLPSDMTILAIHRSCLGGDLYVAAIDADKPAASAVVARNALPSSDRDSLESTIPARLKSWNHSASTFARSYDASEAGESCAAAAASLDEELRQISLALQSILQPLFKGDSLIVTHLKSAQLSERRVLLLLDPDFADLPFEMALANMDITRPVSRDFSLHAFCNRMEGAADISCSDNTVCIDPLHEFLPSPSLAALACERAGWKSFETRDSSGGRKLPSQVDWVNGFARCRPGCFMTVMPGPFLSVMSASVFSKWEMKCCTGAILLDRADTEACNKRMALSSGTSSRLSKISPTSSAALLSLLGVRSVVLSQWSRLPEECHAWAQGFLDSWKEDVPVGASVLELQNACESPRVKYCSVTYGLPNLKNVPPQQSAQASSKGAQSSTGKTKKGSR